MTIKPDHWIRRMALEERMIEPFEPLLVSGDVFSYGLSSYGYDARLADQFKYVSIASGRESILDPKAVSEDMLEAVRAPYFELKPQSFVLGRTVEYFRIPLDVVAMCVGKSSYARCGVLVNATPLEPGWQGYVTLCIANVGSVSVRLYAGEGIAQILFFQSDEPCETDYASRGGKYQAQQQITPARVG